MGQGKLSGEGGKIIVLLASPSPAGGMYLIPHTDAPDWVDLNRAFLHEPG